MKLYTGILVLLFPIVISQIDEDTEELTNNDIDAVFKNFDDPKNVDINEKISKTRGKKYDPKKEAKKGKKDVPTIENVLKDITTETTDEKDGSQDVDDMGLYDLVTDTVLSSLKFIRYKLLIIYLILYMRYKSVLFRLAQRKSNIVHIKRFTLARWHRMRIYF